MGRASLSMTEREAYIALNMMEGIGPVGVRALIERLGSPQAIFEAAREELLSAEGIGSVVADKIVEQRASARPADELKRAAKLGATIITRADAEYPGELAGIHDPPLALYVLGNLLPVDRHAIGVVGSRHTTFYGRETAESLSYQLAHAGFTVVSGLARGIDTAAHHGALKARGRTIAVLGGGFAHIFPPENRPLAMEIAKHGAVLSEFPVERQPDKTTFPIRNRIVSGLSRGVVVVEAGLMSGALITANQALEQGRAVFAVPGRIDSPGSKGVHRLIKNGARLVENVDDILQEFEFLLPRPAPPKPVAGSGLFTPLDPDEEKIVRCLEDGEKNADEIIRQTGIGANRFGAVLLGLEMKKIVRLQPGRMVHLRTRGQT